MLKRTMFLVLALSLFTSLNVGATPIGSDFETFNGDPLGTPSYGVTEKTGYYIWADDLSRRDWHVRWTSVGIEPVTFSGEISIASGSNLVADNDFVMNSFLFESHNAFTDNYYIANDGSFVAAGNNDFSGVVGDYIDYRAFVNTHQDGLDFTILGDIMPSWLLFDLSIVGNNAPADSIFIGAGEMSPVSKNFKIAAPVPEPNTLLLLGSGLIGLAFLKRRKQV